MAPCQNPTTATNIPAVSSGWDIFTRPQVSTVREQTGGTQDGKRENSSRNTSPLNRSDVNMAYLPTSGSWQELKWFIPMKVKLGIKSADNTGGTGNFGILAAIAVGYY